MSTLDFDDEGQLKAAFAEAVRVFQPPAGLEETIRVRLRGLAASESPQPTESRRRITLGAGGLSTGWRIALGSVGVAAALAMVLSWMSTVARPLSAMEEMAKNIRHAQSHQYRLTVRITQDLPGRPGLSKSYAHVICRLASGTSRIESWDSPDWKGPPEETEIHPLGKPGIRISHRDKKFVRLEARQLQATSRRLDDLESLGTFSGQADRELGTREINGSKSRGFQVDMQKISDYSGLAEIWLDIRSHLPVLVRYEIKRSNGRSWTDVISDIQWNIAFDPKVFDATPPEGYTDATPKRVPADEK